MTNPNLDRELDAVVEQYLETAMLNRELCTQALRLAFLRGRAGAFEEVAASLTIARPERPS